MTSTPSIPSAASSSRAYSTASILTAPASLSAARSSTSSTSAASAPTSLAAGDPSSSYVDNSAGPIPQTTIAPPLLFGDIGVKRATEEQQKLPYYGPPALEGK